VAHQIITWGDLVETDRHFATYQIRVKGHLDQRWTRWFEDFEIELSSNGETIISGPVMDQAALHGTLNRIRDLGLELISVERCEPQD